MNETEHNTKPTWKDWLIRAVLLIVGCWLLFMTPAFLEGHLLAKVGGALATLSAILGPHRMGELNTAVILTLVYLFAVGPTRLLTWIRRDNPLDAPSGSTFWRQKKAPDPNLDPRRRIRFQF